MNKKIILPLVILGAGIFFVMDALFAKKAEPAKPAEPPADTPPAPVVDVPPVPVGNNVEPEKK